MATEPALRVAVWSDRVRPSPFCYLESPEFERLREACDSNAAPDRRAYELRPGPAATLDPGGERLHRVRARSVYPMAGERGVTLRLPPAE